MFLKSVALENYRNLGKISLDLEAGFWLVLGQNGQGKSNLLESIQVVASGKSRRTDRDRELISRDSDWFRISGRFEREERGSVDLTIKMTPQAKELVVSGNPVRRLASYMSEVAAVSFSSDDVAIVLGEPTHRRQFLNEAVSQISRGYLFDLARYRRALDQKNRALKDVRERLAPTDALDVWDKQIAEYGGRVCARRERFVRQLQPIAGALYEQIAAEPEELEIDYSPSVKPPDTLEGWPQALSDAISERRHEEIARGISLVGPQRDDLSIGIKGLDARAFASRGQARSAVLAIRLAQAQAARDASGEWPLIVMDDVFAELDPSRRAQLAELAGRAQQVFASAAAEADLPPLPHARRLLVCAGAVTQGESLVF